MKLSSSSMKSIIRFFQTLFSKETVRAVDRALHAAAPYVNIALPIVEQIVKFTPTRADDEIIRVIRHFGLDRVFDAQTDRSVLLRDIAVDVVRQKVKDPVSTHVLNLGVELA